MAACLDRSKPGGYADHHLYLSLSDVHRRQANSTDFPSDWRWDPQDYIDSLPGIRAMVARLPVTVA